jgi:uncharacterized membrane protein
VRGRLKSFGAFWYDFVVGDDWRIAVGVIAALLVTYGVSESSVPAWWIVPAGVATFLTVSLWRTTVAGRRSRR